MSEAFLPQLLVKYWICGLVLYEVVPSASRPDVLIFRTIQSTQVQCNVVVRMCIDDRFNGLSDFTDQPKSSPDCKNSSRKPNS